MDKNSRDIISIFKKTGAFLEGHFLLSSGLHSNKYVQCALVLQYPGYAALLARKLAEQFKGAKADVVVSPAIGGIVLGQEVGRAIGKRAVFAEREEGKLALRRGFDLKEGEKVLVVEDVLTTGGSVREIIKVVKKKKAKLVGVGCIVNRSTRNINFKAPLKFLVRLEIETFDSRECSLCKQGIPVVKPGSRKQK